MKGGEPKELGTGRVAFLARMEAVKKELETGRTVMSVYREYEKQIGISYSQFDRYVNKFIRSKPIHENHGEKANDQREPSTEKRRERATGFTLNTDTSDKRKKTIV